VRSGPLVVSLLLVTSTCRAQEPSIGAAREVAITPLREGGLAARLTLVAGAPDGSVFSAALVEEEQAPSVARNQTGVRGGQAVLLLRFPERAAPGLYEAHLAYDPTAQPRWVSGRFTPARRAIPIVLGTVDDAQAARDQAVVAAAQCADALVAVAAETAQAFGPRAARWTRASLGDWLRDRAVPRALGLDEALQALRPTRALAREDADLRAIGRRALLGLGARARAACLELELALPSTFAAAGPVTDAGREDDLLVDALAVRARARRGALAPEPSPLTLERLERRVRWLLAAASAPPDVARPDVVAYVRDDARQALARVRPALLALGEPRAVDLAADLAKADAALATPAPQPELLRALGEHTLAAGELVRRRHLAEDRAELVALRERLADAGGDAPTTAAWRRRLAVVDALLAAAPPPARELVAALRLAGDAVAARKPVAPEVEARWSAALAALDASLGPG
jgi:hypothetical protein